MFNKDKERLSKCLELLKEIDTDEMSLEQAYDIFSAINNVTFALSAITAKGMRSETDYNSLEDELIESDQYDYYATGVMHHW
jgi:hypothetical protein